MCGGTMFRLLGILGLIASLGGPALAADPPGTPTCGSGGVDSQGNPCTNGKTTADEASKTPYNGASGRGSGGNR
jgi:hypothetical protein